MKQSSFVLGSSDLYFNWMHESSNVILLLDQQSHGLMFFCKDGISVFKEVASAHASYWINPPSLLYDWSIN